MKLTLVFLAIVASVLAVPYHQGHDQLFAKKQQDVLDLLKYINNPIYNKEHFHVAQSYSLEQNAHHYKNDAYKYFAQIHHDNFLKKGEIFSVFDLEHVHQAKALFKLFYHADTYETFFKTALWARHHLNEGLFMYTFSVAVVHRDDTQGLVLPPIYEIYPHFFFNSEVIQKAYQLKMSHYTQHQGSHQDEVAFTIHSNYSGHYLNVDPEQSLSSYLEDVGINAFYFYFNLYYPYWMNSEEFHVKYHNRGEFFYYLHKQLYARYHLERVSHGLGDVEYFNWDVPFKTGYYPSLTYTNGLAFPERPHFANLNEYFQYYGQKICQKSHYGTGYTTVDVLEQRIKDVIDSGFVHDHQGEKHSIYTEEGINVLGNIIEGNADSPNYQYYGSYVNFARHLLGYSKEPLSHHKLAPSALEHYTTSLRDPAFYHIFQKVLHLIDQYKQNLPTYHYQHLYHEGLKVENVEVEPLVTYYDNFFSDITNGLYVTPEEYETNSFRVKVHQYRLNHKNFNYKVHVAAKEEVPVVVKVFLGPKYDEHGRPLELSQVYDKAYELDHFVYHLKAGKNVIQRNSADYDLFVKDSTSYYTLYKHIMQYKHSEIPTDSEHQVHYGFPLRYKLPRGSVEGTTFQMYVIVYPYVPSKHDEHFAYFSKFVNIDSYPMGYPFDRPTEHEDVYHVPNSYVKHVKVYHEVNKFEYHEDQYQYGTQNEVEGNKYHHTVDEHEIHHNDDFVYKQVGDHNNYHQYHQVNKDEVHYAEPTQEYQKHETVFDHKTANVFNHFGKFAKQLFHDVDYQKKYHDDEHRVPSYDHDYQEKYHGKYVGKGQYDNQDRYAGQHQVHVPVEYGYGKALDHSYDVQDEYTPYHGKVYRGVNSWNVDNEYHHTPYYHHNL